MSAFLLNEDKIGMLAAAAYDYGSLQYARTYEIKEQLNTVEKVAEILARENLRSLASRYGDDDDDPEYIAKCQSFARGILDQRLHDLPEVTTGDIGRLASCYEYQSCESSDYYESTAALVITQLRGGLISNLNSYNDSSWWG